VPRITGTYIVIFFNSDVYKINFVANLPNCGHSMYTLFAVKGKQIIATMLHIHKRHISL